MAGGGAAAWTPASLPSLVGWWDASDAASFTYSSGVVVSQWNDLSGNARHFTQATTTKQPSRNGTQNGLDTVVFDGTTDYLDTGSFTLAQPLTIIDVVHTLNVSGIVGSIGGNLQTYISSSSMKMYAGSNEVTVSATGTGLGQWSYEFNGTSSNAWKNGTQTVTNGNPGTSGTTTGLRLGERNLAQYYSGEIMEVIVVGAVLSTSDRQAAESYLKTKWGTP